MLPILGAQVREHFVTFGTGEQDAQYGKGEPG
jgi:hypothetical protein